MPMNIERFGNTSAGTLPILIDEQTRAGNLKKGDLCMMLALGAGIHWGCALVRAKASLMQQVYCNKKKLLKALLYLLCMAQTD